MSIQPPRFQRKNAMNATAKTAPKKVPRHTEYVCLSGGVRCTHTYCPLAFLVGSPTTGASRSRRVFTVKLSHSMFLKWREKTQIALDIRLDEQHRMQESRSRITLEALMQSQYMLICVNNN
jgi:hypothetical protein